MRADQNIGSVEFDNLFNSSRFEPDVIGVTIESGEGILIRGTVLSINTATNKCVVLGTEAEEGEVLEPFAILTDAIDATSTEAYGTAYRTGDFNRNALIVNDGYELSTADELALRKVGIMISEAVEY
jgi:hypothetical protein